MSENLLTFNSALLTHLGTSITAISQSLHAHNCFLLDHSHFKKAAYISHRAKGAYIANICRPDAFNSSSKYAKIRDPKIEDVKLINRVITSMKTNREYVHTLQHLDDTSVKIIVLADVSFTSNEDRKSHLGLIIAGTVKT